jgi:hypothetical protein
VDATGAEAFMRAFVEQYRAVHQAIREQISDLEPATLGWSPGEDTNSIAVLVTHVIGSEMEAVRTLAGVESDRVRAKEFEVRGADAKGLLSLVDHADATLDELAPSIGAAQLTAEHVRRASLDKRPRPGVYVLMHSLAHAREHLGQLMLTSQLAADRD